MGNNYYLSNTEFIRIQQGSALLPVRNAYLARGGRIRPVVRPPPRTSRRISVYAIASWPHVHPAFTDGIYVIVIETKLGFSSREKK